MSDLDKRAGGVPMGAPEPLQQPQDIRGQRLVQLTSLLEAKKCSEYVRPLVSYVVDLRDAPKDSDYFWELNGLAEDTDAKTIEDITALVWVVEMANNEPFKAITQRERIDLGEDTRKGEEMFNSDIDPTEEQILEQKLKCINYELLGEVAKVADNLEYLVYTEPEVKDVAVFEQGGVDKTTLIKLIDGRFLELRVPDGEEKDLEMLEEGEAKETLEWMKEEASESLLRAQRVVGSINNFFQQ